MKAAYAAAMERLYLACIVVSAVALVAITLVIPYGVFAYVMNSASSWPEPFSVLAMVPRSSAAPQRTAPGRISACRC
jgi:TRAP-type C4-dicarboxylate transport system permease small subunit